MINKPTCSALASHPNRRTSPCLANISVRTTHGTTRRILRYIQLPPNTLWHSGSYPISDTGQPGLLRLVSDLGYRQALDNGVRIPAGYVSTRIKRHRERMAAESAAARRGTVGSNPALRSTSIDPIGFNGTNRHGNRRPVTDKGQGEWRTVSAFARDGRNPQWDRTVSS